MAVTADTGKILWEEKGFPWSQITAIGDTLLCQSIKGPLTTVKIRADKFEQLSTLNAGKETCWTQATYAGGRFYLRNNDGRVACYTAQ